MTGTVSVQRLLRACLGALGLTLLWLLLAATDARADEARPAPAAPGPGIAASVLADATSTPAPGALALVADVVASPAKQIAPSTKPTKRPVAQQESLPRDTSAPGVGKAPGSPAQRESAPSVGPVLQATASRAATTVRTSAATVDAVVAAASTVVTPVDSAGAVTDVLEGAGAVGGDLLRTVSSVLDDVPGQVQPLPQAPVPVPGQPVHQPSTIDDLAAPAAAAQDPEIVPPLATTSALATGLAIDGSAAASSVTGAGRASAAVGDRGGAAPLGPGPAPWAPGGAPDGVVPGAAGGAHGSHSGDNPAEPGTETILDAHAAALSTAATAAEHPAPPRAPGFRPE
jgi:hypothetical protein